MIAQERLYHTADKARLVPEGDPEAAFLAVTPGQEFTDAEAEALGLKAYHGAVTDKAVRLEEAQTKAAPPAGGVSFPPEAPRQGAGGTRGRAGR
jgi:hypothetical protein